jgi:hypothetical protein
MTPATDEPVGHADVRTVGSTDALPIAPALGLSLDAAKDAVYRMRRRGFVWQLGDGTNPYYADAQRGQDLNLHALDRGTRRLAGETDESLWRRLAIQPSVRQFAGSAIGMRYLVEDVLGHTLAGLSVYVDDHQARILESADALLWRVESDRSHILSAQDQVNQAYAGLRQNRLFSQDDLSTRYTFWISIEPNGPIGDEDRVRIQEMIDAHKPAWTRSILHFVPGPVVRVYGSTDVGWMELLAEAGDFMGDTDRGDLT